MKLIFLILFFNFISCQDNSRSSFQLSKSIPTPNDKTPTISPEEQPGEIIEDESKNIDNNNDDELKSLPISPTEDVKKSFKLHIYMESVLNKFQNAFLNEAYASDMPYCDTECNSSNCLYLVMINSRDLSEEIICSKNNNQKQESFEIHNLTHNKILYFEVRTYKQDDIINSYETEKSTLFTISEDEILK